MEECPHACMRYINKISKARTLFRKFSLTMIFVLFSGLGIWQTRLLCIVREISRGGSVAVAVGDR